MTDIIFSFDTEDYVNKEAADAILNIANILREENVRGCFNVVGRLAESLVKWGRTDVIEALKYHEIDNHSLAHSHHPTINEYTDLADYDEALALEKGDTAKISNLAYVTPFLTLVWTFFVLGEKLSPVAFVGLAFMLLGIFVQIKEKPQKV